MTNLKDEPAFIVLTCVSMLLYAIPTCLAFFNMCKYWGQRSFSLGIFYTVSLSGLLLREIFFVTALCRDLTNTVTILLLIMPGLFTLDSAIAQIGLYAQLILRVQAMQTSLLLEGS